MYVFNTQGVSDLDCRSSTEVDEVVKIVGGSGIAEDVSPRREGVEDRPGQLLYHYLIGHKRPDSLGARPQHIDVYMLAILGYAHVPLDVVDYLLCEGDLVGESWSEARGLGG